MTSNQKEKGEADLVKQIRDSGVICLFTRKRLVVFCKANPLLFLVHEEQGKYR